jgi:hypothetical protein
MNQFLELLFIFVLCLINQINAQYNNVIYHGNLANEKPAPISIHEKISKMVNSHVEKATSELPKLSKEKAEIIHITKTEDSKRTGYNLQKKEYLKKKSYGVKGRKLAALALEKKEKEKQSKIQEYKDSKSLN